MTLLLRLPGYEFIISEVGCALNDFVAVLFESVVWGVLLEYPPGWVQGILPLFRGMGELRWWCMNVMLIPE